MAKRTRAGKAPYRVFLSHSHQDRWISQVMKERMEQAGVTVWLDAYDVPGGAEVKRRIREGMLAADECLILFSPASRWSDWVRHEGGLADAFEIWTTPVLLHVGPDAVPETLQDVNPVSINDFDTYVAQLAARAQAGRRGRT